MQKNRNPHADITQAILADLKEGVAPWVKPWQNVERAGHVLIPHNAASGRPYSGGNVFMIWLAMYKNPAWTVPAFLTFKQALDAGGNVRKGEKGTRVYYVGEFTPKDAPPPADGEEARAVKFLKTATVFNIAQCDGLDMAKVTAALDGDRGFPGVIGEFYDATGAHVVHGTNSPCYVPSRDMIMLPDLEQFASENDYHATRLHELVHWTGHKSREDRHAGLQRYGDRAYAAEELVAELGAALLCAELGITGRLQHAEYIGHWIKLMEDHERAFMAAASKAQAAVNHLRGLCLAAPARQAA